MMVLCECNNFCSEQVEIPLEDYADLLDRGLIVISNNCLHGPQPTDVLVEERDGYKLYRETH